MIWRINQNFPMTQELGEYRFLSTSHWNSSVSGATWESASLHVSHMTDICSENYRSRGFPRTFPTRSQRVCEFTQRIHRGPISSSEIRMVGTELKKWTPLLACKRIEWRREVCPGRLALSSCRGCCVCEVVSFPSVERHKWSQWSWSSRPQDKEQTNDWRTVKGQRNSGS